MTAWSGRFVRADPELGGSSQIRRSFELAEGHGDPVRAELAASALGIIEVSLNGNPVSDDLFVPGWTTYERRVHVVGYDVLRLLRSGSNEIIGQLGCGWYAARLFIPPGARYGEEPAGFVELSIYFHDGHRQTIATDETWLSGVGDVISDNIYDGEKLDARQRKPERTEFGRVGLVEYPTHRLEWRTSPPIRRLGVIPPARMWSSARNTIIVDFGQNLVGWVRCELRGERGSTVTLRHAEVLEGGQLSTRPLRSALATDKFILSGGWDVFEPTLTYHGFRYVEIDGWPGGVECLRADGVLEAVVVGSDLRRIGSFECSDPLLNRFHENVVWSTRGNFFGIPTDCPQRDERAGWTGDIAIFAPTASFLFDTEDFLRDWLCDVRLEQDLHDGIVPFVVPDVLKYFDAPEGFQTTVLTAIWSDAIVWVPWALWRHFGSIDALRENFAAMLRHARRALDSLSARGVWEDQFQFGDWLDPDTPPERPEEAKADAGVVATISLYRSLTIIAATAELLGSSEKREFEVAAERLREAFYLAYVDDESILSDCTTVYTLAIAFEILHERDRAWAGDRLASLVHAADYRITTGFAGTPYICDALTATEHHDDAYRLLLERASPSWLCPVTMGATTIWERWDSLLPDGRVNPGSMTSFNHYALGAVADWIHRIVGGIAPHDPARNEYLVAPRPGGDLTWASSSLDVPSGRLTVRWTRSGNRVDLAVSVPESATVVLRLPKLADERLAEGRHERTFDLQRGNP